MPTNSRTIADLIREYQHATGSSYGDIARLTGLSKPKIGQLAKQEQVHMPRADTLAKLARGLGLPLHSVQAAALASAGVVAPEVSEPDVSLLVERYRALSDDSKRNVSDFVAMLYQREARGAANE
ncbi:helix-turn-helix domain-containing protein [Isoptericola dokdonensis]|nr:helix-turn-helix transcriptional regulator [Isoptericola dokdonensis]